MLLGRAQAESTTATSKGETRIIAANDTPSVRPRAEGLRCHGLTKIDRLERRKS